ncbi:hypothetical protein T265_16166, partial [Opisthorchis viverrini]
MFYQLNVSDPRPSIDYLHNTSPFQSANPARQGVHTVFSESAGIGKKGSVHSPGYPTRYPLSTFKAYTFTGQPYEHVYLKFLMVELGKRN